MEQLIAGVDEAGRGPLAGPVFAAVVILNGKNPIQGLADSKMLVEKERNRLFNEICLHALEWSVGQASVEEIDRINILQATFLAMQRAVSKLKIEPTMILVDGNKSPSFSYPSQAIVKGDVKEPSISAASIVAKVLRDRLMKKLHKEYPLYGFAQHKGYATPEHLEALRLHGPTDIHRRSFYPVAQITF